jgi:hypothetical protein
MQIWRELTASALANNIETPVDLTMVLLRQGQDLELETGDESIAPSPVFEQREVCAIFDRGVLPRNPALVVRMTGNASPMPLASEVAMPFLFVLLFPHGERLWHIGMAHSEEAATAVRNR